MTGDILAGLAGRSVALVGCAASAAGTGLGAVVDGHDVVARTNFGCPVPPAMIPHVGARTDLLYHVLRHGERELSAAEVLGWRDAAVGVVVSVLPSVHPRTRRVAAMAVAAGVRWATVGDLRAMLARRLRTTPNTGVIAVAHLLTSGLSRLDVYGCDFYTTGHFPGQAGETAAQAAAQVGGSGGHNQRRHRRFVASLLAADRRLTWAGTR